MRILKTLAVVNTITDTKSLDNTTAQIKDISLHYERDIEKAIEKMSLREYDLLIFDKALPEVDFRKLQRLSGLLHPDAAIVEFNFNDEDFMRYKMSGLMSKWTDAQSESKTNFIDNPDGI